ncbi:MAG: hypothetical protein Q9M92_04750 [Enterobacterales bacterium]|nr:hypothetical protein [Enterobacterales bacterium]
MAEMKNDDQLVVVNQLKTALKNNLANYNQSKSQLLSYQSKLKQYKKAFKKLKLRSTKAIKILQQSRRIMDSQKESNIEQQQHLDCMESILLDVIQMEVRKSQEKVTQSADYLSTKSPNLATAKQLSQKLVTKIKTKTSNFNLMTIPQAVTGNIRQWKLLFG